MNFRRPVISYNWQQDNDVFSTTIMEIKMEMKMDFLFKAFAKRYCDFDRELASMDRIAFKYNVYIHEIKRMLSMSKRQASQNSDRNTRKIKNVIFPIILEPK